VLSVFTSPGIYLRLEYRQAILFIFIVQLSYLFWSGLVIIIILIIVISAMKLVGFSGTVQLLVILVTPLLCCQPPAWKMIRYYVTLHCQYICEIN